MNLQHEEQVKSQNDDKAAIGEPVSSGSASASTSTSPSTYLSSSHEEDDPNSGVFVEDLCSQSISSVSSISPPQNPLFNSHNKALMDATNISASSAPASSLNSMNSLPSISSGTLQSQTSPSKIAPLATRNILQPDQFPENFHASPEPIRRNLVTAASTSETTTHPTTSTTTATPSGDHPHHFHLLRQIREDQVSNGDDTADVNRKRTSSTTDYFQPYYYSTKMFYAISKKVFRQEDFAIATWIGFWALLNVTCANYVLSPMRDAVALQVGVQHIPKLTLASSVLAFLSSVPIGWLFEAPDPSRRKVWKKMGLTRGETQGTSLALFYRFFALSLLSYALGFQLVDWYQSGKLRVMLPSTISNWFAPSDDAATTIPDDPIFEETQQLSLSMISKIIWDWIPFILSKLGHVMYIAFFLVVHLARLHSISLVWGVTTEAMEYEDVARKGHEQKAEEKRQQQEESSSSENKGSQTNSKTRLQRLAMVSFGGTVGGIWGSIIASSMANILHLPGLLIVSAFLLEISAELSIELGRIMQKHWEEQQIFKSCQDLASLDTSMKRSASLGSMKRVASGNSLMKRVASGNSINQSLSAKSLSDLDKPNEIPEGEANANATTKNNSIGSEVPADDNTFTQRLLRGIKTILKSRLLMAIFTYNALFASTTVLLSFQRAELVANRNNDSAASVSADTAFLANINMASSVAVFAMQASGIGAIVAQRMGPQGSLALMPIIRLIGVLSLAWWHRVSNGVPPNLILFLMLDECTRVVNLAVAKPVRESLWRGLSNEARYEAKPIVDTLANRWGAGSASFCVSVVNKALLWLGMATAGGADPLIFGLPPVLFLCLIVAAWWSMVSVDLGQIRKRIDMELKKRQ